MSDLLEDVLNYVDLAGDGTNVSVPSTPASAAASAAPVPGEPHAVARVKQTIIKLGVGFTDQHKEAMGDVFTNTKALKSAYNIPGLEVIFVADTLEHEGKHGAAPTETQDGYVFVRVVERALGSADTKFCRLGEKGSLAMEDAYRVLMHVGRVLGPRLWKETYYLLAASVLAPLRSGMSSPEIAPWNDDDRLSDIQLEKHVTSERIEDFHKLATEYVERLNDGHAREKLALTRSSTNPASCTISVECGVRKTDFMLVRHPCLSDQLWVGTLVHTPKVAPSTPSVASLAEKQPRLASKVVVPERNAKPAAVAGGLKAPAKTKVSDNEDDGSVTDSGKCTTCRRKLEKPYRQSYCSKECFQENVQMSAEAASVEEEEAEREDEEESGSEGAEEADEDSDDDFEKNKKHKAAAPAKRQRAASLLGEKPTPPKRGPKAEPLTTSDPSDPNPGRGTPSYNAWKKREWRRRAKAKAAAAAAASEATIRLDQTIKEVQERRDKRKVAEEEAANVAKRKPTTAPSADKEKKKKQRTEEDEATATVAKKMVAEEQNVGKEVDEKKRKRNTEAEKEGVAKRTTIVESDDDDPSGVTSPSSKRSREAPPSVAAPTTVGAAVLDTEMPEREAEDELDAISTPMPRPEAHPLPSMLFAPLDYKVYPVLTSGGKLAMPPRFLVHKFKETKLVSCTGLGPFLKPYETDIAYIMTHQLNAPSLILDDVRECINGNKKELEFLFQMETDERGVIPPRPHATLTVGCTTPKLLVGPALKDYVDDIVALGKVRGWNEGAVRGQLKPK